MKRRMRNRTYGVVGGDGLYPVSYPIYYLKVIFLSIKIFSSNFNELSVPSSSSFVTINSFTLIF